MKIPTAEEFMNRPFGQRLDTQELMIEFAKLHVEAALEAASKNVEVNGNIPQDWIDRQSILDAYPLENIK